MIEKKIYLVGITDSTAEKPGVSFLPLGPYEDDEEDAMIRARLWIADVYEASTGVVRVRAGNPEYAQSEANLYLRDEYTALRAASLLSVEGEAA